jgi:hypothetical protein
MAIHARIFLEKLHKDIKRTLLNNLKRHILNGVLIAYQAAAPVQGEQEQPPQITKELP